MSIDKKITGKIINEPIITPINYYQTSRLLGIISYDYLDRAYFIQNNTIYNDLNYGTYGKTTVLKDGTVFTPDSIKELIDELIQLKEYLESATVAKKLEKDNK